MNKLVPLMRTSMPAIVTLPRVYVAAACGLDGLRALHIYSDLGESVLTRLPFDLGGVALGAAGVVSLLAGIMLAIGLLTRVAVIPALAISVIIIGDALSNMDTLGLETGMNYLVRALGTGSVGLMLLIRGAGVWSMDASLAVSRAKPKS